MIQTSLKTIIMGAVVTWLWVQMPVLGQENYSQPHQQLARELLRELVEIDTTHSTGSTTVAAQALAGHLIAAGFTDREVQVLEEVPRKGNLIVRFRGRDAGSKPLLLLAHLDVVEADPADWTLDPFKFTELGGYYYGRGTLDDKDEAAIHVANLIRLREEGFVPDRDIIVALTADEEGGVHNGVAWLLENHRDLIDAEFALNEGGGGYSQDGRHVSNNVQASEKIYQSFRLLIRSLRTTGLEISNKNHAPPNLAFQARPRMN